MAKQIKEATGCILFKNYIKPQRRVPNMANEEVVSYLKTTSNHNDSGCNIVRIAVVSYLKTTSNHNHAS